MDYNSISIKPYILYLHTDTDTSMHICILTADYTVKPVLSGHSKKKANYQILQNAPRGAFCNPFLPSFSYHLLLRSLICPF